MTKDYPRLFADADGVWREDKPDGRFGIRWEEIYGVVGYKLDGITEIYTVIELEFESGHNLELNSAWRGFGQVVASIGSRMLVLREDWFTRIERLAPRERLVVIWRKNVNS